MTSGSRGPLDAKGSHCKRSPPGAQGHWIRGGGDFRSCKLHEESKLTELDRASEALCDLLVARLPGKVFCCLALAPGAV